ncbi:MAG: 30S ribosomal protein S12 methylthiotransferase RimO [Spirochaetaceae bacterium]
MEKRKEHTHRLFALENLGCAKNQVDAEVMIRYLKDSGWIYTEDFSKADIIIINSCGFIEPAKQESIETTLELSTEYPKARILLAGCLSQRYGEELHTGLQEADGIFGNRDLSKVVDAAESVYRGESPLLLPHYGDYDRKRDNLLSFPGSVYLKISEGCDHRCSFCAIPLIRGGGRSIAKTHIVEEAKALIDRGVFEINLIAQDLASYGKDLGKADFIPLLRELGNLSGDYRIRLLYIHPDEFPSDLVSVVRDYPVIVPYFDIPFQHASEKVLRAMGRRGNAESYLSLIEKIREGLPDAVIRSTLLTGFYGEGESEFGELLEFQEQAQFDWAGMFAYSPEEDTPALAYEGKPGFERPSEGPRGEGAKRVKILQERQYSISESRMERFVGKTLRILVEEPVEGENLFLGRGYLHAPEVDGAAVIHLPEATALSRGVDTNTSSALEPGRAGFEPGRAAFEPGKVVSCRIVRRNNIDLEGVVVDG